MLISSIRAACAASLWAELAIGWAVWLLLNTLVGVVVLLGGTGPLPLWLVAFSQIATWYMAAAIMVWINGFPMVGLLLGRPLHWAQSWLAILLALLAIPLSFAVYIPESFFQFPPAWQPLEQAIHQQEEQTNALLEGYMKTPGMWALAGKLLVFAVIPAIAEESFFRGWLLRAFAQRLRMQPSVLLTAVIFSLVHFQMYGFFSRMQLGVLLGYVVWYSHSLRPAMILHATYNGIMVLAAHLTAARNLPLETAPPRLDPAYTLLMAVAVAGVLSVFFRIPEWQKWMRNGDGPD